MPKGFVNPVTGNKLLELEYQNLLQAKKQLRQEIQHYREYYQEHPNATHINPVFGELNAEQWQKYHFKHCFHHLSQFGLVDQAD